MEGKTEQGKRDEIKYLIKFSLEIPSNFWKKKDELFQSVYPNSWEDFVQESCHLLKI